MMLLEYKPWGASASHTIGDTITTYMYDVSIYNSASGRQQLVASFKTLELALDKIERLKLRGRIPHYTRRIICSTH